MNGRSVLKSLLLFVALFVGSFSFADIGHAEEQPCQWNYKNIGGIATATYCGNVVAQGTVIVGPQNCPSIEEYGGAPGNNDNTDAWNKFISQSGTSSLCINFQDGTYNFSGKIVSNLTIPNQTILIKGAGADGTILNFSGTSGGLKIVENNCSNSFHVQNLTFSTSSLNGGNALDVSSTAENCELTYNAQSDVNFTTFRGSDASANALNYWSNGVNVTGLDRVNFIGDAFQGSKSGLGNGISLIGLSETQYTTLVNVDQSIFLNTASGFIYGSYVQGVNISNSNFNGGTNGIIVPSGSLGTLAQLYLVNDQFNTNVTQIDIIAVLFNFQMTNSNLFVPANAIGLNIASPAPFILDNVWFNGTNAGGNFGMVLGASAITGGQIKNSGFYQIANGINIQSGSQGMQIIGNQFITTPVQIINNGALNVIKDNVGYNPVGVVDLAPGASPWGYISGSSPETVYLISTVGISSITQNGSSLLGGAVAANTLIPISVDPNSELVITYTGVLAATKMVH